MRQLPIHIIAISILAGIAEARHPFPNAQVLQTRETPPDAQGQFKRVELLRTNAKHPLVRLEQRIARDPTGGERVVGGSVMVANHLLVSLKPDRTEADLKALVGRLGGRVVEAVHKPGLFLVELPGQGIDAVPEAIERFGREAIVARTDPNYILSANATIPTDPRFSELYGMNNTGQTGGTPDADIDAPEAWDIHTGSRSLVVGVIDTGIDYTHPDLQNNIFLNQTELKVNGANTPSAWTLTATGLSLCPNCWPSSGITTATQWSTWPMRWLIRQQTPSSTM